MNRYSLIYFALILLSKLLARGAETPALPTLTTAGACSHSQTTAELGSAGVFARDASHRVRRRIT